MVVVLDGSSVDTSVTGPRVSNANDLPRTRVLPCLISAFRTDLQTAAPKPRPPSDVRTPALKGRASDGFQF
jgi:hypothetical protein